MDWTTLAPTALGGTLALGGGFIGQMWGERRAVAREQREWAREDKMRTFDDRRRLSSEFMQQMVEMQLTLTAARHGAEPLDWDWHFPLMRTLTEFSIFATEEVEEVADDAFEATFRWGNRILALAKNDYQPIDPHPDDPTIDSGLVDAETDSRLLTYHLREVIRRDLGIDVSTGRLTEWLPDDESTDQRPST